MEISIIIVNWHSKAYLRKCLKSIYESPIDVEYEIIVIDCASYDGSEEMVQNNFPLVKFIQSHENLGFAKANNQAFEAASGRKLLFLNPDTEIIGNAIRQLLTVLDSSEATGGVGAKLLNSDGTIQKTSIRAFPGILNQIFDSDIARRMFPSSKLWGMGPLFKEGSTAVDVNAISGACMMIKREAFEAVQMFSEDYFMYSEDIDLCRKLWDKGWKIQFVPNAYITHHGGGSSSQSSQSNFSNVMMLESRYQYFCKFHSVGYGQLFKSAIFSASIARIVILMIGWPISKLFSNGNVFKRAISKWRARLLWTLGMEPSINKFRSPA